jgi:branched-chain amino acid transport system substrate-binding protein
MRSFFLATVAAVAMSTSAWADFTDNKVVIGVMGDQSGVVSDVGGPGSILAARMAVEDFGGSIDGTPIEILTADHQNKPEVGSAIAREWFDREGVDVIVDLPHSGVVFSLMAIANEKKKSLMISGAASFEITGKSCSPYVTHWTDDTYSLAQGTAAVLADQGLKSWYFLTADYSFGTDLEKDATNVVKARGGEVVGVPAIRSAPPTSRRFFCGHAARRHRSLLSRAPAPIRSTPSSRPASSGSCAAGRRLPRCTPSSPTSTVWVSKRPKA